MSFDDVKKVPLGGDGGASAPAATPGSYGGDQIAATPVASFESVLGDVPLELSVELGRVTLSLRDVAGRLGPGSIITLAKLAGEQLDVRVNDRLVARGEAVAVGERYGVRIVEIIGASGGKVS